MSSIRPTYGQVDHDYGARLATTPAADDGPIWMVNLMRYKAVATYGDGNPAGVSGREADERYAPVEILDAIGAEVVFVGDVDTQLLGVEPRWDRVAVVRYPTRRAFVEMQTRPDFRAKHEHKQAGMASTIVMGCRPADVPVDEGLMVDWSAVAHPPTADDGPVMVVHVVRYAEGGRELMTGYQDHAAVIAARHGGQVAAWFGVEGTIVGDGRSWDDVRFNRFPSKAAFLAVVADPARVEVQRSHRAPAMADTYTLIVRPTIDRFAGTS